MYNDTRGQLSSRRGALMIADTCRARLEALYIDEDRSQTSSRVSSDRWPQRHNKSRGAGSPGKL